MTTITIKSPANLSQFELETMKELIETYLVSKGKILLQEVDFHAPSEVVKNDISLSKSLGENDLPDFKG